MHNRTGAQVISVRLAVLARDDAVERWNAEAVAALGTTCTHGCLHCCRHLVCCQPFEAQWIAEHAPTEILDGFGAVAARQSEVLAKFGGAVTDASALAWLTMDVTCPAWDGTAGCLIYQLRPVACATFWSLSPPRLCNPAFAGVVESIDPSEPRDYVEDLQRQIDGCPRWVPMAGAVAEAVRRRIEESHHVRPTG